MQPQQPATVVANTQHVDFAEAYQQLTHAYRVVLHRDPPGSAVAYNPDSGGSRPTNRGHPTTPTPTSNAKSPKYLLSLSEDELIEYRKTLYGHDSDQVELESDGCYQRADATVSKPSWHVNLDWSYTVSDELTQRMYSDPKIVSIRQEWIECMAESGYQNLTSEEDLIDTLHNEMANLIHTLIPLSPRFDSGQEFLHSLSKESREMFDAFLSKELRLAVASYECNAEHESQVISISREIEESILESNPPLQIQSR